MKVTDEQYIRAFNELGTPSAVAKHFGLAESVSRRRKRSIERRHGIALRTRDPLGRAAYNEAMVITDDRVEVKLKIKDGVVLVTGDQHFHPGNIPTMHRAFCYLAKKIKPFATIWNGDAFDGATISRHPSIGWENKPTVKEEIEEVQKRSMEVFKAAPSAKRIWTAGNHDLRFESRLAAVAGEYRDVTGIHLKDHIQEWHPAWFVTINEGQDSHTEIRHREKGGVHASYNNTKESGITIVTGHDHRADVIAYDDRRGRRYGVRHGMGADSSRDAPFVHYLEGKKTNWQSGIAVLTYRNGQLLMPELALRWGEDSFEFRGEIIHV